MDRHVLAGILIFLMVSAVVGWGAHHWYNESQRTHRRRRARAVRVHQQRMDEQRDAEDNP